ncbi:MAG: hypothetical protein AAGJ69_10170 [Cyanobacteria bacterium J06559_1]
MPLLRNVLVGAGLAAAAIALIPTPASADIIVNTFCELENSTDETFDDRYFDVYYFDAQAGDPVAAIMTGPEFDTIVRLVDANGDTVLENDDARSDTTNSAFFGEIPADGGYAIVATTHTYLGEGPYYLVAATGADASQETIYDEIDYAVACNE